MDAITLKNLYKKVQENRLRNLAINIVKYQNFKTSVIIKKIDNAGYSKASLLGYINNGISYIKTGKKIKQIGVLCNYIDEAKANCIQALTPREDEKRLEKPRKQKNIPVQNVLKKLSQEVFPTKQKSLAVKVNDTIIIQSSEEEANGFIKGIKFMDRNLNVSIINISYEEI